LGLRLHADQGDAHEERAEANGGRDIGRRDAVALVSADE
jgi:hypothetical protein